MAFKRSRFRKGRSAEQGFTLLELAVTVVMIGILGTIIGNYLDVLSTMDKSGFNLEQNRISRLVADSMLEWAENHNQSRLPAPFTDTPNAIRLAPVNPAGGGALDTLIQLMTQKGVTPAQINSDGTNLARVRVFQIVNNLTAQVPFFGLSGGNATLTFQAGSVYITDCPRTDTVCNRTTGSPPGDAATGDLTAANITTWTTMGTDGQPARVNTLDLQKRLLRTSSDRVDIIREALRQYYNAKQIAAGPAAASTNFFPTAATSQAGQNPTTNEGCHDGWYPLGDPAADADASNNAQAANTILAEIGLGRAEFGVTAWGAMLEYCRDYEPNATGTASANTPPNYSAIRINPSVSTGLKPLATGNLVFSL